MTADTVAVGQANVGPSPAAQPDAKPGSRDGSAALAFAVFVPLLLLSVGLGVAVGRPVVLLVLAVVPILVRLRSRPIAAAAVMALAGAALRAALVGAAPETDQIETTLAALRIVLQGGVPYGAGIAGTSTGAPFPYGPLALAAYVPGVWTEVLAAALTMLILVRAKTVVGLAFYAACPLVVRGTLMGTNDVLPGLLVTTAVVLMPTRPRMAAAALAAAIAIKPYAGAWLPGLVGAGGIEFAVVFAGASAVFWAPLALWGIEPFMRSVSLAAAQHDTPANTFNLPLMRLLAVPLALAALLRARSLAWQAALGAGVFLAVLFFDRWASLAYLLVPLPLLLIAIEQRAAGRVSRRRRAAIAARGLDGD